MAKNATERDQLGYVRRRLADLPPTDLTKIAADAGISLRTVYTMRDDPAANPTYRNVLKVFELLKGSDTGPGRSDGKH